MENDPAIACLPSHEQRLQAAAKKVGLGNSRGVNPSNLRNWLRPREFRDLQRVVAKDTSKVKGGRGRVKLGKAVVIQASWTRKCWFDELEEKLDVHIEEQRHCRLKVTTSNVRMWMMALVSQEIERQQNDGTGLPVSSKLLKFKCSKGWMRRFLRRNSWTRRRATNKRAHSAEDLLGAILGFVRCLRKIRQDNPSDDDPVWGVFGPEACFNVDSVPLAFADSSKTTIARKGSERVSIIVPSGMDKRQATLHITIRPRGEQPHPALILRGATTAEDKEDTKKRSLEMAKYVDKKVHVLWQANAWLDGEVARGHWVPCFKKELARLGLEDKRILLLADNLGAQKADDYLKDLDGLNCFNVFGPKGGTDIWQPVDRGIGHTYQERIAKRYLEWTKSAECMGLFEKKKNPSSERVRELLVQWTHDTYEELEAERAEKEANGEPSIFELAFLRTGCLVTANGSEQHDKEMRPEGVEAAIKNSKDDYYKNHEITTFTDLLRCSDGCDHKEQPQPPAEPGANEQKANEETLRMRSQELEQNNDPRAVLLVKCLREGFKWAGSSLVEFLAKGTGRLLQFLSEVNQGGELLHDLDLYREEKVKKLGKRFCEAAVLTVSKRGAVDKYKMVLKGNPEVSLEVDQVNLFKKRSSMSPSTDIWGNLCLEWTNSALRVGQLVPDARIPLSLTLHNALRIGLEEVACYVLRQKAMPTYDDEGNFKAADYFCDGRFQRKLHVRSKDQKLVRLEKAWIPGPVVPPHFEFLPPELHGGEENGGVDEKADDDKDDEKNDDDDDDDDDSASDSESDSESDGDDEDEIDSCDISLQLAKQMQRKFDQLPVWGVMEQSVARAKRPLVESNPTGQRRSTRPRREVVYTE